MSSCGGHPRGGSRHYGRREGGWWEEGRITSKVEITIVARTLHILFHSMGHFPNSRDTTTCCCPAYICSSWTPGQAQGDCLKLIVIISPSVFPILDPFLFLFPSSPFPRSFFSIHLSIHLAPLAFSLDLHRRRCRLGRCDECLRALRTALRGGLSLLCKTSSSWSNR